MLFFHGFCSGILCCVRSHPVLIIRAFRLFLFLRCFLRLQRLFQPPDSLCQDLDRRKPTVIGLHKEPGCIVRVGLFQHFLIHPQELPVFPVALLIPLRHPPGGLGIVQQFFKPLLLLFLRDGQEKFDDHCAILAELPLKGVDLLVGVGKLFLFRQSVKTICQHPLIPAVIKNRDPPPLRRLCPEPPQIWAKSLFLRRFSRRIYLKAPGIQPVDQLIDLSALSRSAEALKHEHHRDARILARPLQFTQPHT